MREIKFRAKRIDDGRWVYGQYFRTPLTDENSGASPESGWFFLSDGETRHCIVQDSVVFTIDVNTLGQFTGSKDKNNKEIYEGDLLGYRYVVTYVDGSKGEDLGMNIGFYAQRDNFESWSMLEVGEENEVIGNVHDNPDLLK